MKKYWIAFSVVIIISFLVLSWVGVKIYQQKPPIPENFVSQSGELVFTKSDIQDGQNIWQAMGGMESGSVWGHGSYVAPDWTADWLHREAVSILDIWSKQQFEVGYDKLSVEKQSSLKARLEKIYKINTYDQKTGNIKIDYTRFEAIK